MGKVFAYLGASLVGLIVGALSLLLVLGLFGPTSTPVRTLTVDGWGSDWDVGSANANAYVRAKVAVIGLFALKKEHSIYFIKNTDGLGDRLDPSCFYRVTGGSFPARWWSVTLYAENNFLPQNNDQALSFDASRTTQANWMVTVGPTRPAEGAWISSQGGGQFDLTLRLYAPDAHVLANPQSLTMPTIDKLKCEGAR